MMVRMILGVAAGPIAWGATAALLGFAMRAGWPAYAAAEPTMAFDTSRLVIGATATLVAGSPASSPVSHAPACWRWA